MKKNSSNKANAASLGKPTRLNAPDYLFYCGCSFLDCASKAAKGNLTSKNGVPPVIDSLFHAKLPAPIVNIAFSIELALKGLAMQEGKTILHTHDLLELFNVLDKSTQENIIEHYKGHDNYKSLISIRLGTGDSYEQGGAVIVMKLSKDRDGVLELLRLHANYFEKFRYLFEIDDQEERIVWLSEFFNFSFSVLTILGKGMGKTIQYGTA